MITNRVINTDQGAVARSPWARWSYDRIMRVFGGMWFLLLAIFVAIKIGASPADLWAVRLANFLLSVFYLLLASLIVSRSPAKAHADGPLPRAAAFVGTYMPWTITLFGKTDQPLPNLASAACVLMGIMMMLVTVRHLGRSFSLVPQAHRVVQTGPYRWIRHPLYLSEEIAIIGAALQVLSPVTLLILVVHLGVQVCRIHYEEDLLRRTCPEYASYEASRWRLIPYIW